MSTIGKNIKKIRMVKKLSQADFADLFEISRASVGSYEEGRAEPKIDTIVKIANYFSLSIDLLLTKELTVNELYKFDIFKDEYHTTDQEQVNSQDKDLSRDDTPLITKENYLEYIVNYHNKDYINRLPFIRLPNTQFEKTRAFEVQDSAMEFNNKGLLRGDILSCSPVEKDVYAQALPEQVYVVVTEKEIFVRRLAKTEPNLTFVPDNPNFSPIETEPTAILELWKVEGFYSTMLKPPSLLEERMALMEKKMAELEKNIREVQFNRKIF